MSDIELRVDVRGEEDVCFMVLWIQHHAGTHGFGVTARSQLGTAASELGYNILYHAGSGSLTVRRLAQRDALGLAIEARDRGPGIADIAFALREHTSTRGTLGLGLPGVRRMMDELEIRSTVGLGTTVTAKKWLATARRTDRWF